MTYEECLQLIGAYESAVLLKERLREEDICMVEDAASCADSIGEFIASMMAQAWKGAR